LHFYTELEKFKIVHKRMAQEQKLTSFKRKGAETQSFLWTRKSRNKLIFSLTLA